MAKSQNRNKKIPGKMAKMARYGYLCTIDQVGKHDIHGHSTCLDRQTVEKRACPIKKISKVQNFKNVRDLNWEICAHRYYN